MTPTAEKLIQISDRLPRDAAAGVPTGGAQAAGPSARVAIAPSEHRQFWRSLEEWAGTPELEEFVHREFPDRASEWTGDAVSRRQFLALLGASAALAGAQGCSQAPPEKIVPYVRQPEEIVPGKPLFYATAMTLAGTGLGLLVESHMGRPTKIEGNPDHPASLGATDVFAQAAVLALYDPDRSKTVTYRGRVRTWDDARAALRAAMAEQRTRRGAGLRLITEAVASPTLLAQIEALLRQMPEAKWCPHEPAGRESVATGSQVALGEYVNTIYRFDQADVVLSLDADFLGCGPGHLRYVRDFMAGRAVAAREPVELSMNRLYMVECTVTTTGAKADHRVPLRPSLIEPFARATATRLGIDTGGAPRDPGVPGAWLTALVDDLEQHRGRSIVIAGDHQPPAVHALAHAMNHALGNVGRTVLYTDPIGAPPAVPGTQIESLTELVDDMKAGRVELLMILGGNPAYTAAADLDFAKHLQALTVHDVSGVARAALRFHLSLYEDETSQLCDWHLPEAHFLEAWSDVRAYDGTATIVQPLILPLYGGKSAHELLAALGDEPDRTGLEIVRSFWRSRGEASPDGDGFDAFWRKALHDGVVPGTAYPTKTTTLRADLSRELATRHTAIASHGNIEIAFRPDPTIFDGRFANNGWLQELPKPLTTITWDNAALMSSETARRIDKVGVGYEIGWRGGEHGRVLVDVVEITVHGRTLRAPVWIVPTHPDGTVTVHLGHGRTRAGRVGTGVGFNAYGIRTNDEPWWDAGVEIRRTSASRHTLAVTQGHFLMRAEEGNRHLIRAATLGEFRSDPHFAQHAAHGPANRDPSRAPAEHGPTPESQQSEASNPMHPTRGEPTRQEPPPSLYPEYDYPRYRWAMAINLTSCIGCGACVVACQAENNIPIVGKEEVTRGREMHWLRVDRYFEGDPDNAQAMRTHFQPVPCMQCENAPCEVVCPATATVHSDEGLNDMVYNRCVGTRYCSNNCPYKVRRFNFFHYADFSTESLKLLRNPDVTVRSRGVMEKCTYCVQRINEARITAGKEDRRIRDGELLTACQAVCPAQAIVFGDLNDPHSLVSQAKACKLNYSLLDELNTRPRTSYLAAVNNPNSRVSG